MPKARARIGTSGWNYADWKPVFYPKGVAQRDWLRHYATQFDTVELNSSFYRIPPPKNIDTWASSVPQDFRFAVKLWRGITHFKKLRGAEGYLRSFLDVVNRFPSRALGPLLLQLPPNLNCDAARLDEFLQLFKRETPGRWKLAVEFRNEDWLRPEILRLLDRHRAALCLHDGKRGAVDGPNDASFIYIRRHGPGGDIHRGYSSRQIDRDAQRVSKWRDEGKAVYLFFNNDPEGRAVKNAKALAKRLS